MEGGPEIRFSADALKRDFEGEAARKRMAVQSASTALRLGLSATLPLIFVAYAAWTGALGGAAAPSELYAVWNSAQNGGEGGYQPYGEQSYVQQPAQLQAINPYYNAVNTAELSTNVNPYDAAALQYSGSGPPQNQMQTLHALASAKRLYHQMQAPGGSAKSEYNSAVGASLMFSFESCSALQHSSEPSLHFIFAPCTLRHQTRLCICFVCYQNTL